MMRFASLSVGVLVTQITSILVAADYDDTYEHIFHTCFPLCPSLTLNITFSFLRSMFQRIIYTEHQNDPLDDTSAVKFKAALDLESTLVDD